MTRSFDRTALRVLFVTDGRGDEARIESQVAAAVAGGVRAVQLREPSLSARALVRLGERLRPRLLAAKGLLFVNDRIDCAVAGAFDGVQIGHRSVPWSLARRVAGPSVLLCASVHDENELAAAEVADCDLVLLSPVWPTASKPGVAALGVERAARCTASTRLPVLWLGGATAARARELAPLPRSGRPAGFAVLSAIAAAADPEAAAAGLSAALAAVLGPAGD